MSKVKAQKVVVVVGPTASGKSDLAIKLAKKFNGEIISADSRQVYRGMDIGTGKVPRDKKIPRAYMPSKSTPPFNLFLNDPTASPTDFSDSMLRGIQPFFSGGIRHWLLDVANPKKQFTVSDFQHLGQKAIADILSRSKVPIVCGGTGFYIDSLVYDTRLPNVAPNKKLRARLEKKTTARLLAQLVKLDQQRAKIIDPNNKRRIIRALEIVLTTHKPVQKIAGRAPLYDTLWFGIIKPKDELAKSVAKRFDVRLRQGMVIEARRLHAKGLSFKRMEAFGLEYRWLARFLQKKVTRDEMRIGILYDSLNYAKRQMTWFKKNKHIKWTSNQKQAVRACSGFLT